MPQQQKVLFKFGTAAQYLALDTKQSNALYFLTDTGELYKGDIAIARSHVYQSSRQTNETNDAAITRILNGAMPIESDVLIITNADNTIDAFIYNASGNWIQINSATDNSALSNRVTSLETAVSDLQSTLTGLTSAFSFQGSRDSFEDLALIGSPRNGDVYQVGNAEYVWNGNSWIELGTPVDLSNYATLAQVNALIGEPASTTTDPETQELVTVPATGIFAEFATHADQIIPLFNGSVAGLVPVATGNLTTTEKANMFLNALGNWTTVTSSGSQTYTDPEGNTYNSVEDYVTYMITNHAELIWESIDNSGNGN